MGRPTHLGEDSSVQDGLGECPVEDNLGIAGNGRSTKSRGKILHLVMTASEGYKVLGKLKSDPLTSDVPIVVLTH